jgi:hypothetical protein
VEERIDAAQPRRTITADRPQHRIGRRRQNCPDPVGKVWFEVLNIGKAGHQLSLLGGRRRAAATDGKYSRAFSRTGASTLVADG